MEDSSFIERTESKRKRSKEEEQVDDEYFKSYENLSVHEIMLKDIARTSAYRQGIEKNSKDFFGKVVLDVGAGSGILSMFAARSGASKVYAVEASKMATLAHTLVIENGFQNQIEVLHGRVEDIQLPEKVDIIISEWMGFFLLHESMLDSVLIARDRWLKAGGFVWPSRARLFLCPVSMDLFLQEKLNFWENVQGLNFSSLIPIFREKLLQEPQLEIVHPEQILANSCIVKDINLHTVIEEELKCIQYSFEFEANKSGILHGLCAYFEVLFEGETPEETITLSTAPDQEPTHWKQTVFLLPESSTILEGKQIQGSITLAKDSQNQRHYNVSIEVESFQEENLHNRFCQCTKCKLMTALGMQE